MGEPGSSGTFTYPDAISASSSTMSISSIASEASVRLTPADAAVPTAAALTGAQLRYSDTGRRRRMAAGAAGAAGAAEDEEAASNSVVGAGAPRPSRAERGRSGRRHRRDTGVSARAMRVIEATALGSWPAGPAR